MNEGGVPLNVPHDEVLETRATNFANALLTIPFRTLAQPVARRKKAKVMAL